MEEKAHTQSSSSISAWHVEQAYVKSLAASERQLPAVSFAQVLKHIGITVLPQGKPVGVIKYIPSDFIVEEIDSNGDRASVVDAPVFDQHAWGEYIEALLVKSGVDSTLGAVHSIAEHCSVPLSSIQYAGVKDGNALTAQHITVSTVSAEKLLSCADSRMRIYPLHSSTDPVQLGALLGNHFTIVVRTATPIDQHWVDNMVAWIAEHGIINFYGPQRFHEPRCMAHHFGRLLFQGKSADALKSFLTVPSLFELPYVARLRKKAASVYGQWQRMIDCFSPVPQSCFGELRVLQSLASGASIDEALQSIGDQVHYWALGYTSFLANEQLSQLVASKQPLPKELPLLLSSTKWAWDVYKKQLHRDKAHGYVKHLASIPSIRMSKNPRINTIVRPRVYAARVIPEGVVFEFDLPKGAYATTVLSYFFDLITAPPRLKNMSTNTIDSFALQGRKSLAPTLHTFEEQTAFARDFNDLFVL